MKKTFLLLITSMMFLAGCQKEEPELVADGFGSSVQKDYTCECGAQYSVTCKNPNMGPDYALFEGGSDVWQLINNPSWGKWTVEKVENGVKEYFPYYESLSNPKMYFKCSCGRTKEYSYKDFQTQRVSL